MKYMDVNSAAEKWGITGRRVRILCNDGRIDGAVRNGWTWLIPVDTPKPGDGRVLRRFKNLDIRPGFVDVDKLKEASNSLSISTLGPQYTMLFSNTISLLFALENERVEKEDVAEVLSGELCYSLTLRQHLLIINFTAILRGLFLSKEKWNGGRLKETYIRLLQGVSDSDGEYFKGFVGPRKEGEKVRISAAMETMFSQYEESWSSLHPLSSGVILSGEILRIQPYKENLIFLSYLVFAGELLRGGILPPLADESLEGEIKAAYSLVYNRGIYTDMTSLIERLILRGYSEIRKNV